MVNQYGLDVASMRNDAANFMQTPLFDACAIKEQDKALKLVKYLLEQGVCPSTQDELKQLPIFYAAREGHTQVIELLLKQNINVNHLDTYGQTPVFYCVREGKIETTQ